MEVAMRPLALSCVLVLLLLLPAPASPSTAAATHIPVLAFYYPWYSPSQFTRAAMWDVPVSPYESDHRSTMERQVREARGAGITGFISSWWGQGNRTDSNFATLLEVAREQGFTTTIYFETGGEGLRSESQIVDALKYVKSRYGAHPSLSRVSGKPAIFFWNPSAGGSPDAWKRIRSQVDPNREWHWNVETDRPETWLEVFDGVHLFSAASWTADATATYRNMRSKVDAAASRTGSPKAWAAGVAPGWDNSRLSDPVKVIVPRQNGAYYSARWEAALASRPDLITITSWNEWGEGTAIEPGASYGNQYLDITRRHSPATSQAPTQSSQAVPGQFVFKLGFKLLADRVPHVVGQPVENEWHNPENGDGLQRTTTGLMVWRKADNWTAFTNGHTTWINGPYGVQSRLNDQRFAWER
jgi:hypothetical protein